MADVEVFYILDPHVLIDASHPISRRVRVVRVGAPGAVRAGLADLETGGAAALCKPPFAALAPITPASKAAVAAAERLWLDAQAAAVAVQAALDAIPRLSEEELRAMTAAEPEEAAPC